MHPSTKASVKVEGRVSPSEDPLKVAGAMLNLLGEVKHSVEVGEGSVEVTSSDPAGLDKLHDQLRDRRVRGAARKRFLLGRSGDSTTVMMNRQAAAAGVVALCDSEEESPLGPLNLTIASDDLDAVIQWLTDFPSG